MKIPKSFQLGGHTISVRFDDTLLHQNDALGEARYRDFEIVLQKPTKDNPIPPTKLEQVFLHEKVHFLFYIMNEHDLRGDEKIVDLLATLFHQSVKTEKGSLNY
jgi:hypothetical protein